MNASVCVMVTVLTEQEERRQLNLHSKHFSGNYSSGCGSSCNCNCNCSCNCNCGCNCDYAYNCVCPNWDMSSHMQSMDPNMRSHNSRALHLRELSRNAPLEQVVRQIALQLRLEHVFWSHDVAGGQLQARFDLVQDERYECLLCTLQDWGIGERPGTHVTAINCLETRVKLSPTPGTYGGGGSGAGAVGLGVAAAAAGAAAGTSGTDAGAAPGAGAKEQNEGQRLGWQNFMDSVRCRLNVNQVVRVVRRDATINFDFVVLLMAAALLSCVGLVENSFLFLSSSMLISPLMGPIIAAIFGSVIGDRGLRWLGIKNELIGIAISVVTGFIFGGAICLCGLGRFFMLSTGFTEEIISRCDTHSLAIGLCTALASGAAAAIGVLGGNTGSLVGVAISASLLPPAVNAGLLWAIALCTRVLHIDQELLKGLSKHREYSPHLHIELFVCATVSMALTLLNVVCVWLMGVVVLRIKEVAPAVQRDQQFWRHDVRLAREVALRDPELHSAIDRLDLDERRQVDLDAPQYQHTWSPGTVRPRLRPEARACQGKDNSSNYHTVHGFQDFCITLHKLNSELPRRPSPALPSFLDVFTPLEQAEHSPTAVVIGTQPPQSPALAQPEPQMLPSGSGINNYRSLPDLRQASYLPQDAQRPLELSDPEPHTKSKISRCVHWSVERRQPLYENPELSPLPSSSMDALQRAGLSQVLVPLPLDRRLRLMSSRQSEESDECDYQHEFNV
ncbi:uncharacterized protein [Drosophila virilis]|uniref:DUF389 domain-containing protein n=1 Tax=Drosophila virilis TaxID=7244 RepID=B4M3L5_DROVI|nr:uncharacterized protein LOC6631817 [Drosophila virilis]EDW65390.2 uncharacterized protein Dvir_GJ18929 [Drosophila virilis]